MTDLTVGQIFYAKEPIVLNPILKTIELLVNNTGDRPVQVGSHYHFFEANSALDFDREKSFGMRLDIPSGTAVRFEPGEEKKVQLVEYAGNKIAYGFNGLTMGNTRDPETKKRALEKAKKCGFKGVK